MRLNQREESEPADPGAVARQDELALHVLHSLDQPICIVDADDCYLFANKAYAAQYGLGPEVVRGQPLRELLGEAFYEKRLKVLLARARKEGAAEFHGWVDLPELGRRYVESDIRLYTYPGLADKHCLILQCRDVTDREELDQRRRKSLNFQEDLLGKVPAMLWMAGPDGVPYFFNDTWLNFTGCTLVEQVRGGWLGMIHPDDRQTVMDRIQYAISNSEAVHLEFRLRYLMGGYRWVRLCGTPLAENGGSGKDFVAAALDIQDAKSREEKMREMLQEERHLREQALQQKAAADRANREKSAYLSLASHEIRTPMNPVIGFADLLASNPNLDAESREMAQMILKAGKNLLTLIDEVLDYAKIEAGVLQLAPEVMDVHDLLIEMDSLYAFDAKSRGIELRISDQVKTDHELYQDRLRLQQVLGTLVSNAIKFTHTGHVEIRAATEDVRVNGHPLQLLRFTVSDTGIGMTPEEVEKLFQPFARADNEFTDKYSGAGLGLAIAQKLADAMRGTIKVDSEPGKGSRVELVIPFVPVPEHLRKPLKRRKAEKPDSAAAQKPSKSSIIVVDDEESSRQVNASLMKFLGYQCDTAANGGELLDRLRHHTYEMILLDIMMPGLDGLEVTRRIRNGDCGEGNREAYIIAVTGCSEEEDRLRSFKAGVSAFLAKPVTLESMREAISGYHAMGRSI